MSHAAQKSGAAAGAWRASMGSLIGSVIGPTGSLLYITPVMLLPITTEFGWQRSTFGLAVFAATLATAVGSPLVGWVADRWGDRAALVPGIIAYSIAIMSVATASGSVFQFAMLFGFMGLFAGALGPVIFSKIVSRNFAKSRGLMLGLIIGGGGAIGGIVLPQSAALLVARYGWRTGYVGLGVLILLVGMTIVVPLIRNEPRAERQQPKPDRSDNSGGTVAIAPHGGTGTLIDALSSKWFWIVSIALSLAALAVGGLLSQLVAILSIERKLSTGLAISLLSTTSLLAVAGRISSGLLLDMTTSPRASSIFCVAALVGVLILQNSSTIPALMVGCALLGIGLGAEVEIGSYVLSRYFGMRAYAQIVGCFYSIYCLGIGFGPFIMGYVFDTSRSYEGVFLIAEACLAGSALMLLVCRRYAPGDSASMPGSGKL